MMQKTRKEQKIEYILMQYDYMRGGEKLTITGFGKHQDLKLYIHMKKENNLIFIEVKQDGKIVDTTMDLTKEMLKSELERIYKYKF